MQIDFSHISIDELNYRASLSIDIFPKRLTNSRNDVITYKKPNSGGGGG